MTTKVHIFNYFIWAHAGCVNLNDNILIIVAMQTENQPDHYNDVETLINGETYVLYLHFIAQVVIFQNSLQDHLPSLSIAMQLQKVI